MQHSIGRGGLVAYAASKGVVAAMTLPLAQDLAPYFIRAMCIAPGPFDTPMLDDVPNPKKP
ncbi:SDR family NAD(P)-dependent oxidoreductase [Parasphingorhabdus sp.]|uniref:SDR family NAD(P)-dependent oxidoreductase n=1 Tax=Parasphingorhabdus sp. TaxID=2709688 RepID=UPI001B77B53A|nr:SDR family NAD(P)-dependent oxidoreductase [Sphingomonadales bacterium]